jgi:hypothetical protein
MTSVAVPDDLGRPPSSDVGLSQFLGKIHGQIHVDKI